MDLIYALAIVLIGLSALLAAYRVVRGPSILDRMVASDVLIVVVMCALLTEMSFRQHTWTLPVVLVMSMLGFVGSVSVARYVSNREQSQ